MEHVKLFYEEIKNDMMLQEKIKALQAMGHEEAIDRLLAIAKEKGFEVTKTDLVAYLDSAKKSAIQDNALEDSELEAVAGGMIEIVESITYDNYGHCLT